MEIFKPHPTITADFTPPPVSLERFQHYQTGVSLREQIDASPEILALKEAYEAQEGSLDPEQLGTLEQAGLRAATVAVRSCIQYDGTIYPWDEQPKGNCFTYTWLLAEIGVELDLVTRVMYCNGHAFNLFGGRSGQLHVVDGMSKHMSFFDIGKESVPNAMFSVRALLSATAGTSAPLEYRALNTSNLKWYSEYQAMQNKTDQLRWLEADLPAVAIMHPEQGKRALFTYAMFLDALDNHNIGQSLTALRGLLEANPQAETRPKLNPDLNNFKKAIKRWATNPDVPAEMILEAILVYHAVMPETKSMCIQTADCLRILGAACSNQEYLEMADNLYGHAAKLSQNHLDPTLAGKKKRNLELIARMRAVNGLVAEV